MAVGVAVGVAVVVVVVVGVAVVVVVGVGVVVGVAVGVGVGVVVVVVVGVAVGVAITKRKMMQIKLFEVRDSGTFIPCIGIAMNEPASEAERYLLRRAGYGLEPVGDGGCVLFGRMEGGEFTYDPYDIKPNPRTIRVAAHYVNDHWHELTSGDVICVETILGERATPKTSERLEGVL